MSGTKDCEYCGRNIKGDPEVRMLRGVDHVYCSEFCFKLHFYDAPNLSYEDLQNMYDLRCISITLD